MDDGMTKTGNAAASVDGDGLIRSADDLRQLSSQTQAWIASHYFNIAIACAVAALIVAALYGIRMLGTRLCRRPHVGHWPRIIGRAIARTNLFFIVTPCQKGRLSFATTDAQFQKLINAYDSRRASQGGKDPAFCR